MLSREQFAEHIPPRWSQSLPPRPGTTPIPEGNVRLYHYSPASNEESIRKEGLSLSSARGETYGEPNMIWAAAIGPDKAERYVTENARNMKLTAEFSANPGTSYNDRNSELDIGRDTSPQFLEDRSAHVTMRGEVSPERLTIHTPIEGEARDMEGYGNEELASYLPSYRSNPNLDPTGVIPKAIMYKLGVTGPDITDD
jgi:hypothetical protein